MAEDPKDGGQPNGAATLAAVYRQLKERAEAAVPTIPLELPSRAVFRVTRPQIETWLIGGRFPQHLMYLALQKAGTANKTGLEGMASAMASDITDEDALKILIFARELVQAAVVSPKIVLIEDGRHFETGEPTKGVRIGTAEINGQPIVREKRDEELSADELFAPDFWFIFGWAAKGAKGIPILTGRGETTLDRVETFRPGDERGSNANAGADSPNVGTTRVGNVRGGN